jgi:protein phosphatase methylesterase 1
MVGQMQGKFQMEVVPGVGHMLHEVCIRHIMRTQLTSTFYGHSCNVMLGRLLKQDDPCRIAGILVEFWRRNERVVVGVKKVGEL